MGSVRKLLLIFVSAQACSLHTPIEPLRARDRAPSSLVRAVCATLVPPNGDSVAPANSHKVSIEPVIQRLLSATSGRNIPWRFQVIDDGGVTSWSLPDGRIGVHSGLLSAVQSEDELAYLVAHEMGHVLAKHDAERLATHAAKLGGLEHVAALPTDAAHRNLLAAVLGLEQPNLPVLPYSTKHEAQADRLAIQLMNRANYDAKASVAVLLRH